MHASQVRGPRRRLEAAWPDCGAEQDFGAIDKGPRREMETRDLGASLRSLRETPDARSAASDRQSGFGASNILAACGTFSNKEE